MALVYCEMNKFTLGLDDIVFQYQELWSQLVELLDNVSHCMASLN